MLSFSRARRAAILAGGATVNPLASVPWVAQWKFNNNANDSVGSNNLTASASSPTFTDGKIGGATGATQLVAASSQYWSIADNAILSGADVDMSWSGWVKFTNRTSLQVIFSKWVVSGGNLEYIIYFDNSANRLKFGVSGNGSTNTIVTADTFGALSDATWYFVYCYHDATNNLIGISVNGGTADTAAHTTGIFNGTSALNIGRNTDGGLNYFNGALDALTFAKGAGAVLSATQLAALYNGGNGTETLT